MVRPKRGEVWIVDFGLVGKQRPCLVASVELQDEDRVLVACVPRTTQMLGTRFEVAATARFFNRPGVFDAQGLQQVPCGKFVRKLGDLDVAQFAAVMAAVKRWLGLDESTTAH